MEGTPLVSVVIPTYNRAELAGAAIESAIAQTYPKLEIIVVDDGSTDGTAEVIQHYINGHSDACCKGREFNYIFQSNQGQSRARNRGIAAAKGDWIAFLDSDDLWLPEKIEAQVRVIERFKECGACYCDARLVDTQSMDTTAFAFSGRVYKEYAGIAAGETAELAKNFGGSWIQTLMVRTGLARQIGGFDNNIHFAEDHDFLFRLSLVTSYCYVNRPLAVIERSCVATDPNARVRSWDSLEFRLKAHQRMYEKWLTLSASLTPSVQRTIARNLRSVHSAWANLYLQRGQFGLARQAISTARSYERTRNLAIKWALARFAPHIAQKIVAHR